MIELQCYMIFTKKTAIFIFAIFSVLIFSQSHQKQIDSLRAYGNIDESIVQYRKILNSNNSQNFNNDFAEVLSINNDIDSSFKYLELSAKLDSSASSLKNPLFYNLTKNIKWSTFVDSQLLKYEAKQGKFKNYNYAKKLFALQQKDQLYYYEIHVSEKLTGRKSPVTMALWKLKERINDELTTELELLIGQYGYPKCSENMPCSTPFLILQHSNLKLQEKYINIIEKMCENREIPCNHFAMMKDRINYRKGKPQIYGTQYTYDKNGNLILYELLDPKNLNERREKIGLKPINSE